MNNPVFLSYVDVSACCGFGNLLGALERSFRFVNKTAAVVLGRNIGVCIARPARLCYAARGRIFESYII